MSAVLVPYAQFLECRVRRMRVAAEFEEIERQRTIDAPIPSVEADEEGVHDVEQALRLGVAAAVPPVAFKK